MTNFTGKVAVITGAASGIGRALAERLASEGARLVLADIEDPALQQAAAELRAKGADVLAVQTDVSKLESVQALAACAIETFWHIHVLINNAGVAGEFGSCWASSTEGWRWTLGVNFWGVLHGIQAFLPHMLSHGQEAQVVNTASASAFLPIPFAAAYGVSKAAVVSLSESLHYELSAIGSAVKVSVLCPAAVRTRIAESDRNRPDAPDRQLSDEDRAFLAGRKDAVRKAIDEGMAPAEIAGHVIDAIREQRLYVLTHPDVIPWIDKRLRNIVEGRNPEVLSMLEENS